MFPNFKDIFDYVDWFNYWTKVTLLAYNVGDSNQVNRIFKLTDEKFIARILDEDEDIIKDFYSRVIKINNNPQAIVLSNLHLDKLNLNTNDSSKVIGKIYNETQPSPYKAYLSLHK